MTLFCFADRDCASVPDELDLKTILGRNTPLPPGVTILGNSTTPFPIPEWPDTFNQADYTHTLMWLYAGFNGAWAVTCIIAMGKWKERTVEDSC